MKPLLACIGAFALGTVYLSELPIGDALVPASDCWNLAFITAINPRMTVRDWTLTIAVLIFVAFNFFLWTLPISQTALFLITFPLGAAVLLAFMWFAPHK